MSLRAVSSGKSPIILAQGGVPIGIAPTGNFAANGAWTSGTALGATYSGGIWLYFAAGKPFVGSAAGFYWTVMTNTTVGTVYTNTHTPGTNSSDIPASPTAIVGAGQGANTGVTSEITAVSVTVPGGLMGKNGGARLEVFGSNNNSGGTKAIQAKLSTTQVGYQQQTTGVAWRIIAFPQNSGVLNSQNAPRANTIGSSTSALHVASIDTSVDVSLSVSLQLNTATDWCITNGFRCEVMPS